MAVYREGFKIVESLGVLQGAIYPDAADIGVKVKKDCNVWNMAKQLSDMYGEKNSRVHNVYATGESVEIDIVLLDEWNPPHPEFRYKLSFVSMPVNHRNQYIGYVSIEPLTAYIKH